MNSHWVFLRETSQIAYKCKSYRGSFQYTKKKCWSHNYKQQFRVHFKQFDLYPLYSILTKQNVKQTYCCFIKSFKIFFI